MIERTKSITPIPWLAAAILAVWIGLLAWHLISPPPPPISLPAPASKTSISGAPDTPPDHAP